MNEIPTEAYVKIVRDQHIVDIIPSLNGIHHRIVSRTKKTGTDYRVLYETMHNSLQFNETDSFYFRSNDKELNIAHIDDFDRFQKFCTILSLPSLSDDKTSSMSLVDLDKLYPLSQPNSSFKFRQALEKVTPTVFLMNKENTNYGVFFIRDNIQARQILSFLSRLKYFREVMKLADVLWDEKSSDLIHNEKILPEVNHSNSIYIQTGISCNQSIPISKDELIQLYVEAYLEVMEDSDLELYDKVSFYLKSEYVGGTTFSYLLERVKMFCQVSRFNF